MCNHERIKTQIESHYSTGTDFIAHVDCIDCGNRWEPDGTDIFQKVI